MDTIQNSSLEEFIRVPMRSLNFFNLLNPSSGTLALGLTEHLTEMSTRRCFWGKALPSHKANKRTAICRPIILVNMETL
jgi:hypothetical protein